MFVSPDVVGMIVALFAFTVTVLGGVGGLLAHQSKALQHRFDKIDDRFGKVDDRFDKIDDRFDRLEGELVEVKVAIARLEGPLPKLQRL
jgi:archaellum component FlaC